jgi:hypothetical protein
MNKLMVVILIGLVFVGVSTALSARVMVLSLHYSDGNISLINSTVKYGYYPDYRYQPEEGYKLEIIATDDSLIEDFKFKVPNRIFVDGTDENGEISGGMIELSSIDFALSVPYYENMKKVRIYSTEEEEIASFEFEGEKEGIANYLIVIIIVAIAISAVILGIKFKKK